MKKLSRFLAILAVFALSLGLMSALAEEQDMQRQYDDAVQRLGKYLLNLKQEPVDIAQVAEDFKALGSYEGSNAFYYYAKGLADAAAGEYAQLPIYAEALSMNAAFDERLTALRAKGVALPGVEAWAAYLNARAAEAQGDYAQAAAQYQKCLDFMDAQDRILVSLALAKQQPAASATETPAAPAAPSLSAAVTGRSVSLNWSSVNGATNYSLYRRRTNYDSNYQLVASGMNTAFQDTGVSGNYYYSYYVAVIDAKGNQLRSNEVSVLLRDGGVSVSSKNTNTNTNANDNNNKNNNAASSKSEASADNKNNAENNTKVDNKNEVDNRTNVNVKQDVDVIIVLPTAKPETWSAWSEWSTNPVSSSATRQVETRLEKGTSTQSQQYTYSRWYYYNTAWGKYTHSYTQYTGSNYKKDSGSWQYKTTKEPLAKVTPIDGHQQYSGGWWNEKVETIVTSTSAVTYYRYRDLLN